MKEFRFTYKINKTQVFFGDHSLQVIVNDSVPLEIQYESILHWYTELKPPPRFTPSDDNGWYREAVICYFDQGRREAKLFLRASSNNLVFTHLVDWLVAEFPAKSLEHLSEAEAYKIMGIKGIGWPSFVIGFMLTLAAIFIFTWNHSVHCLDRGFVMTTLAELAAEKDLGTSNVMVPGKMQWAYADTADVSDDPRTIYVPFTEGAWKKADTVRVVAQYRVERLDILRDHSEYIGVIRNLSGEQIDDHTVNHLIYRDSLKVVSQPVLFEVTWKKHNDRGVLVIYAIALVGMIISYAFAYRRSRKKPKPSDLIHGRS